MWYYRLTEVRCQGPWHLSSYAVVVQADSRDEAIRLIDEEGEGLSEDNHRLSLLSDVSEGYFSEDEARKAARHQYDMLDRVVA